MAYKSTGKAAKSASGASMSKYDVEVEDRLKKLEAAVEALEKHSHEAPCDEALTSRVNTLEAKELELEQTISYVKHVETYKNEGSAASDPNLTIENGKKVDRLYDWWLENKDRL